MFRFNKDINTMSKAGFVKLIQVLFLTAIKRAINRAGSAWKYLYRAVDKAGSTVDFLLTAMRTAAIHPG
jgi:hypothetical protein